MKLVYKITAINICILIILLGSIAWVNTPKIDNTIYKLEEQNAKGILEKVYTLSKNVANRIKDQQKNSIKHHKEILKDVTQIVHSILWFHYESYLCGKQSEEEAKKTAFERISKIRYGKNGYIFLIDDNYNMVSHPNPNWQNTYMYYKTDLKGKHYAREMVDKTKIKGEAFVHYWWAKIKGEEFEKLSYIKLFKPWKLYIGTGVYLDDIEKELQTQKEILKKKLTKIMNDTKIGKTGYIYVFDKTGKMILHPSKELSGDKFRILQNPDTGNYFYKDLINAANTTGVLKYKWTKPNDPNGKRYEKISWIKYEPTLGWYIASSAYEDDFKETSHKLLLDISFYGIVFLVLTIFVSIIVTKNILAPLDILLNAIKDLQHGKYDTKLDINTKDEIGILAKSFKDMSKTIHEHIHNLDVKINEKTAQIVAINKDLKIKVQEAIAKTKEQEKQMLQQSRLAQMGEMISMIAHQWRQPLAAISAVSGSLDIKAQCNDSIDSSVILHSTQKISHYLQYLTSTIDDFRDFFKPNREKQELTYNKVLEDTFAIIEVSIINNNIKLKKELHSKEVFYSYSNDLKQVILNILKNAKDALLENKIENPYIKVETQGSILKISDNAGGIKEEIIDKIFDPYFTTKTEKNGTGLGLYMSKMIVEEHCGGTLRVENNKDKNGAIFTIDLREGEIIDD